jgi:hypothetical protein
VVLSHVASDIVCRDWAKIGTKLMYRSFYMNCFVFIPYLSY